MLEGWIAVGLVALGFGVAEINRRYWNYRQRLLRVEKAETEAAFNQMERRISRNVAREIKRRYDYRIGNLECLHDLLKADVADLSRTPVHIYEPEFVLDEDSLCVLRGEDR